MYLAVYTWEMEIMVSIYVTFDLNLFTCLVSEKLVSNAKNKLRAAVHGAWQRESQARIRD